MNELFDCPYIYICRCCVVAKLCLTLCDPMDCSLPDSSVQEISQARILEWVATSFFRELPDPGIEPMSSALAVDSLPWSPQESPSIYTHTH